MKSTKCLAYITPHRDENLSNETVMCSITVASGELNHTTFNGFVETKYFKYRFYGTTIEVIEIDENKNILSMKDPDTEDLKQFGVSIYAAVTLNRKTLDIMASNGIAYNMRVNKYYNYCKQTIDNMCRAMFSAEQFILLLYVKNGAVIYIDLDTDVKNNRNSKYCLSNGFVISDKSMLKLASNNNSGKTKKLTQSEIDKLIVSIVE